MTAAPIRVQRSRAKGAKLPQNTVCVDRTTGFGNPFPVNKATDINGGVQKPVWSVGTWNGRGLWIRDTKAEAVKLSVDAYRAWLNHPRQSGLMDRARMLRGKNLACWCKIGEPCHGDVLLELANSDEVVK